MNKLNSKLSVIEFLQKSVQEELTLEEQKNFLESYELTSAEELKNIVLFFEANKSRSILLEGAIDVCGTGGSGLSKINTSTLSALILASLGVKIAKHGNRAVTSQCGSFDVLDALDLNFSEANKNLEVVYQKENCVFLYAPAYYPLMKHFQDVRKAIKKPTFFNILGPLLNPAQVKMQIIGTPFKDKMLLLAETCRLLGKEKVYVVSGEDGLDEVSTTDATKVVELNRMEIKEYFLTPEDFGVKKIALKQILGGNVRRNLEIAEKIISGKEDSPHRDLVLVNVALALQLTDESLGLSKAYQLAKHHLQKGLVGKKVTALKMTLNTPSILLEIALNKKDELELRKKQRPLAALKKVLQPSSRSKLFLKGIKNKTTLGIIAEIKLASPSMGQIAREEVDPIQIAKEYEEQGVSAISVVCDQKFFNGSLDLLKEVSETTSRTPLLCKDFIIDDYQIYEARAMGADLILLIAALLTKEQITRFLGIIRSLKMLALCEVHNKEELEKVLGTSAKIIGINNRDLHTFQIDLKTTASLVPLIPSNKITISESGFQSSKDLVDLSKRVNGILVGTALMKSDSIERKLMDLRGQKCKVKICGVQTVKEALFCEKMGISFIGLNFVPTSKRKINLEKAQKICKKVSTVKTVGVFMNQPLKTVEEIAKRLGLDYIQLSGEEDLKFIQTCTKPVIKTIRVLSEEDLIQAAQLRPHVYALLLDHEQPGQGKSFDHDLLKEFEGDFFLAGGINSSNAHALVEAYHPLGIDTASGVETEGQRDFQKIQNLTSVL